MERVVTDAMKTELERDIEKLHAVFREFAHICFALHNGIIGAAYGKDGVSVEEWERNLANQLGMAADYCQRIAHILNVPGRNRHALRRALWGTRASEMGIMDMVAILTGADDGSGYEEPQGSLEPERNPRGE